MISTDRRKLLLTASSFTLLPLMANEEAQAKNEGEPKRIDIHGHVPPEGLSAEQVIKLMDYAGISKMVLMPRGPKDEDVLAMYRSAPNRIIPFLGTMTAAWHRGDYKVLRSAEQALSSGIYKGVGELMIRYFGNPKRGETEVNRPADSSFILDLADICAAKKCVIQLHMEPEEDKIDSLRRLLEKRPKTNFIWAHFGSVANIKFKDHAHKFLGDSSTFYLDGLLKTYPNLYTDLSGIQGTNHIYSKGANLRRTVPFLDTQGRIFPKFSECIRGNQSKVMWGLDTPYLENWSQETFGLWVNWADNLLAQVGDKDLQAKIMYQNAEGLLNLR